MLHRVSYSAAQPGSFIQVPETYVSQVMRQVTDVIELKVTLLTFYLLTRSRDYPGYVTHAELLVKSRSMLGMDESSCEKGIEAAVARGVFLTAQLSLEGKAVTAYFANLEADVEAIEQLKTNSLSGTMGATVKRTPNIFELYEQNIGIITPMMAEELKDAQRAYPEEWIEEAFREAVKGRKQNWKYVSRILERWSAEGKGSGAYRPGAVTDDPDKYVKGRFGRIVRR